MNLPITTNWIIVNFTTSGIRIWPHGSHNLNCLKFFVDFRVFAIFEIIVKAEGGIFEENLPKEILIKGMKMLKRHDQFFGGIGP